MVTPWDVAARRPRTEAIRELVTRFISAGVDGLFILGTTGEGTLLPPDDRKRFAEEVASEVEDSLPWIVHTGHDSVSVALDLSLHAKGIGASAVALAPPTRYRLDGEELLGYYSTVAERLGDFPFFLYDIPGTTCNPLGAELLARLRERFPNLVGAKVSRTDWKAWEGYLRLSGEAVLLVGVDEMIWPLLAAGAGGLVSGPANLFPELYVELFRVAAEGNIYRSRELQGLIWKLCDVCRYATPLSYIKASLRALGIDVGPVLPPLRELTAGELEGLARDLETFAGLLADAGVKGGDKEGKNHPLRTFHKRR